MSQVTLFRPYEMIAPPKSGKMLFPQDWKPSYLEKEIATKAGMTAITRNLQWEKFRNYHIDKGNSMRAWPRAWRTWCCNWKAFQIRRAPRGSLYAKVAFGMEDDWNGT